MSSRAYRRSYEGRRMDFSSTQIEASGLKKSLIANWYQSSLCVTGQGY